MDTEERDLLFAVALFAMILTLVDIYTSSRLLSMGYVEGNPFMSPLVSNLSLFVVVNLFFSFCLILFLFHSSTRKLEGIHAYIPILVYCVVRGFAVVNNVVLISG